MRWIRLILLSAIISFFIPIGTVYADSPSVDSVKVYQDYSQTGDWYVVCVYNISGTNATTSLCNPFQNPWVIQLIDNATSSVIGNWSIQQCGMRPFGMYIGPTLASTLVVGGNYSVRIYGNWGTLPNASLDISATAGDWRGSSKTDLGNWVIAEAQIIEAFDSTTYVDTVPYYNYVLNDAGATIFEVGIPTLETYLPDIFEFNTESITINYDNYTSSQDYATGLYNNWSVSLGAPISTALTNAGFYFGVNGRMMGAILTLIGFLALAMIEKSIAFMVIIGGALIGVFPMATIIVLVFLLVVMLVRALFWSST